MTTSPRLGLLLAIALFATAGLALPVKQPNAIRDFLQCRLCNSVKLEGLISDVTGCDFASVNEAVSHFYAPLLDSIASSTFFRYFKVDLEKPCPFWHEDAQCMMEGCSVCTCDEHELPQKWLDDSSLRAPHGDASDVTGGKASAPEGWVSTVGSQFGYGSGHDDTLGRVQGVRNGQNSDAAAAPGYTQFLLDTEDEDDWTYVDDSEPAQSGFQGGAYGSLALAPPPAAQPRGVFINLLQNPEGFTGYAGPSAQRVWRAIQEENCFSSEGAEDQCLEKRTFHRLMSGLQASISTHIGKLYYYPEGGGRWGTNVPLFVKAVGAHKDRLVNLYFAFLFVLRAVVKAQPILQAYSYDTGNATEDALVKDLVLKLTSSSVSLPAEAPWSAWGRVADGGCNADTAAAEVEMTMAALMRQDGECDAPSHTKDDNSTHDEHRSPVERCRTAFNEERLFLVNSTDAGLVGVNGRTGEFGDTPYGKHQLQQEFRDRFRNITRIMDCVSCEKCRVWGKLQILGIGTAIKVLLTPAASLSGWGAGGSLSRQEVVALLNTLHQLATSVDFAAEAAELELDEKIEEVGHTILLGSAQGAPILLALCLVLYASGFFFGRAEAALGDGAKSGTG